MIIIILKEIKLNHVPDCVVSVLPECEFIIEDKIIRVRGVIDDISLNDYG